MLRDHPWELGTNYDETAKLSPLSKSPLFLYMLDTEALCSYFTIYASRLKYQPLFYNIDFSLKKYIAPILKRTYLLTQIFFLLTNLLNENINV